MPDKKFELGDYVEVKDRIKLFYELYGQGRLVTSKVKVLTSPDGTERVMVTAKAYRTVDDPHPGVGTSWLQLPGSTPYTRGSEVENAETSAWGRAIGSLGILIDKSIASSNEIQNKQDTPPAVLTVNGGPPPAVPPLIPPNVETEAIVGDLSRTGTVKRRDKAPLEATQGPDGHNIVFRLEMGAEKAIPQVVCSGAVGEALYLATSMTPDVLVGHRMSVKGRLVNVSRPGTRSFYRLHVSEWSTDDWSYPAEDVALPQPPEEIELIGEAPSEPLGLVS